MFGQLKQSTKEESHSLLVATCIYMELYCMRKRCTGSTPNEILPSRLYMGIIIRDRFLLQPRDTVRFPEQEGPTQTQDSLRTSTQMTVNPRNPDSCA